MRVLVVVEDDPGMRLLIREMLGVDDRLEIEGETSTVAEAIEEARIRPPDVVILDHFIEGDIMGLDGAPLLKRVAPASKLILFTSHDLAVEASREPAIDVFLLKKNLDQLLPTVRSLVGLE